jgi:probable phosphoglycerate mutase
LASPTHRIDLARHAQDESARATPAYHPRPDSPLTDHGIEQARDAAKDLAADYAGIVYSPILRAKQTAELLSEVASLPLLTELPSLSEWRPPSCVYGKTPDEYDDEYREWRYARTEDPSLAYQDGESLLALHERAVLAVHELSRLATENGPILVVSHKVFLGVTASRGYGPAAAFERATGEPWAHGEIRTLDTHSRPRTET